MVKPRFPVSRRDFLNRVATAGGAAIGLPQIIPATALGQPEKASPGKRVTVAVVGHGGMGRGHYLAFNGQPDCTVVAACDVRPEHRQRAKEELPQGVTITSDFRELLVRDDVDAFVVATPHHTHAVISVMAMKAGKDVYCEKPMTRTVGEGLAMISTARRYGRVLQVGTQRRGWTPNRRACELARNHRIGKLQRVIIRAHAGLSEPVSKMGPPRPVPEGFDYDLWLGPAPWQPFFGQNRGWLGRIDFSIGPFTDYGCHIYDIGLWGAEPWIDGPLVEIDPRKSPEGLREYHVEFTYPSGLKIIATSEYDQRYIVPNVVNTGTGVMFEGTEGWAWADVYGNKIDAEPKSLASFSPTPDEIRLHRPAGGDNRSDFLHAVRTRGDVLCPVEGGHRMTTMCWHVWIATVLRRKLVWDDREQRFPGDEQANRYLHYAYRQPWRL